MNNFELVLFEVIKTASEEFGLKILNNDAIELNCGAANPLLTLDKNNFKLFDGQSIKYLIQGKNKLTDAFVNPSDLKTFCRALLKKSKKITLNHLGLCYQVESKSLEKSRLMGVAKEHRVHLYEIHSNDNALWLFIGNKTFPEAPFIEFLPAGKVNDYYLDYWLPHIHLALHTNLRVEEIKFLTHEAFKGNRTANPTVINRNTIYQLRVWLGSVSGINIDIDLLTNEYWNSLENFRKMLKTIV